MEHRLNKEQCELCRLLSRALHDQPVASISSDVDIAGMIEIAQRHKVTSLLYPVLENLTLPEASREIVDRIGGITVQQSYRLLFLSRYVIETLKKHHIDAILLKGSGTAAWYPVPELRKAGDVDLLLKNEAEVAEALRILKEKGFTTQENQLAHHHMVCDSPDHIEIELHSSLAEPFDSEKVNRYLAECQEEFFTHRRNVTTMGITFSLAADSYHAFYLLLHMLQHYVRAGFGIKLLCDWVVFWESDVPDVEQKQFLRLVKESKTLGFAGMITQICVRYLGLDKEKVSFILDAFDASLPRKYIDCTDELMEEIFMAEEFGHSDGARMVVLRGTGFWDYVREFHHQTKLTYPRASKMIVLDPILWVMMLCGFLHRNRTMRKVSLWKILKKAKERGQITEQMNLFQ